MSRYADVENNNILYMNDLSEVTTLWFISNNKWYIYNVLPQNKCRATMIPSAE
jgi:hypothetical protein